MATRWPRVLTAGDLRRIISLQKNPANALRILDSVPSHLHTPSVLSRLIRLLPPSSPLLPSLLRRLLLNPLPLPPSLIPPQLPPRLLLRLNCPDLSWPLHRLLSSLPLPDAVRLLPILSRSPRFRLHLPTLNSLLSQFCDAGLLDVAVELFASMGDLCLVPDRDTYRILMKGLVDSRRLDDGIHLLYSMLKRISEKGCEGDVVVYRMLLEALCEEGRVDDAEDVLGKVLKRGLRVPRLRRAFQKWEIDRGSSEAMKRSIAEALATGGVRSVASYCAVIGDLYSEGNSADADRLFDEMRGRGFRGRVEVYEAKIAALGRAEDGVKVLEEMEEDGCWPRVGTYELVMKGLCHEGKAELAALVLRGMERKCGCAPRKESYEIAVEGLCREGRFVEACGVMEVMLNKRHYASASMYDGLIKGLAEIGKVYDATMMLEEMVSQGKLPDLDVWRLLVSRTCGSSELEMLDFHAVLD